MTEIPDLWWSKDYGVVRRVGEKFYDLELPEIQDGYSDLPADAVKLAPDIDDLGRFVDDVRAEVFDYENGTHRDKLEAFDAIAEIVRRSYLR